MNENTVEALIAQLANGRTELVFDLLRAGCPAEQKDNDGVALLQHCAYYGDVSAMKLLLSNGASLHPLGIDMGLSAAAFHGHWRLCLLLLEQGANVNYQAEDTGETALHSALCKTDHLLSNRILQVLLSRGANPNLATTPNAETGAFMRDCRTKGEYPLHRAAAFGDEESIQLLLSSGAVIDARDSTGDTPLSWASWYLRPTPILRLLCYGSFRIHPENQSMRANLLGWPPTSS